MVAKKITRGEGLRLGADLAPWISGFLGISVTQATGTTKFQLTIRLIPPRHLEMDGITTRDIESVSYGIDFDEDTGYIIVNDNKYRYDRSYALFVVVAG